MKDPLIEFGKHVRELRTEQGYSQESFAQECGMDRTYIGGIERGERNVTLVNIQKIASALGISLPEIMAFDTDVVDLHKTSLKELRSKDIPALEKMFLAAIKNDMQRIRYIEKLLIEKRSKKKAEDAKNGMRSA